MLDFGFEAFGFHEVIARADTRNEASPDIMSKLGMRKEVWCAILREEWEARRRCLRVLLARTFDPK